MNVTYKRYVFEWDLERCCYTLGDASQLDVRAWIKLADKIQDHVDFASDTTRLHEPEPMMVYVYCNIFDCVYEWDILEDSTDEYVEMCDKLVDELKPFFIQNIA